MLYSLFTTPECNLHCRYCGGSIHGMSMDIQYPLEALQQFLQHDSHAIVAFYGGEPLLRVDTVKTMLNELPAEHFVLNTNGFFIKDLGEYIHRFDTILLSIDGRKEITDWYRGNGCYDKVLQAVSYLNDASFSGELIARMAVSKQTDIYQDVTHLLSLFPNVHWQLDVVWSSLWNVAEFQSWVQHSYKPGLVRLLNAWVDSIQQGTIQGIIPFLGVMSRFLHGGSGLPCQAGDQAVAITTDGQILGCPIAPEFTWNELGTFEHYHKVNIGKPCVDCRVYPICGGRCLFTYKEHLWGEEGFQAICEITKFLIDELGKHVDTCQPWKEQLRYPPFNNTTEIIP